MTIYAVITQVGDNEPQISTPSGYYGFFIENKIRPIIDKIKERNQDSFFNKIFNQIPSYTPYVLEHNGFFIYVKKIENAYSAALCNEKPDAENAKKIFNRLDENLKTHIKTVTIQQKQQEVLEIMIENFDKLTERGEKIEDLKNKADDLKTTSHKFKDAAADLNRCWPCNIF